MLHTVMVEVESLLNGRPLTHISVNPSDPEPITPNHFLLGRAQPNIPPDVFQASEVTSKRQWRSAQTIVDQFWKRWMREYVPTLIERRKWMEPRRNLAVNDLVLVIEPNTPRGHWPLARVVKPLPGPDGVVRAALVCTKNGERVRHVAKLCLMETSSQDELVSAAVENGPPMWRMTPPPPVTLLNDV